MPENMVIWILLSVHTALFAAVLLLGQKRRIHISSSYYLWMIALPVIGPVTGYHLIGSVGRIPPDADWMSVYEEKDGINFMSRLSAEETVPLEEALLINDPHKRRLLMMNVLRADPMRYLDLLLMARFNEDTETAHYATATIMELQRHFQLQLQQLQQDLDKDPEDDTKHTAYIEMLSRYCESGLLEGHLLSRQQTVLQSALDMYPGMQSDPALLRVKVRNSLALKRTADAAETVRMLIALRPQDETSWLEGMRVCAETHDQEGMKQLLIKIRAANVDFTNAGREHLLYFAEAGK